MKRIILLTLLIPVLAQAQRYGHTSGSTFYWNKSGEAQKSDSIRYIQGSNITLTQSGNTLTIAGAAGAGSTANVRANTGWTSDGTLARDTLATNYAIFGAKTFGIGGTTQAQNARAKFNVYSYGDSVLVLSASATKSLTDSFLVMLPDGSLKGSGGGNLGFLNVRGKGMQLGSLNLDSNSGISDNNYGGYIRLVSTNGAVNLGSSNSNIIRLTPASQVIIGATATKANQAFLTVNANGTADTTFMVRNNATSATDSTIFFTATGDIDIGGNNLYLGGHRIRSNAAGDSLIFYDGNTMIFAILSDGSTADLVAGTPPFKFFGWHRDEIIFWILTIAGLLIWIVAILAIYDKIKEIRIREHKALPGEI